MTVRASFAGAPVVIAYSRDPIDHWLVTFFVILPLQSLSLACVLHALRVFNMAGQSVESDNQDMAGGK